MVHVVLLRKRQIVRYAKLHRLTVKNEQLENVAIANALQLEAARRRAVLLRFNFVARVK